MDLADQLHQLLTQAQFLLCAALADESSGHIKGTIRTIEGLNLPVGICDSGILTARMPIVPCGPLAMLAANRRSAVYVPIIEAVFFMYSAHVLCISHSYLASASHARPRLMAFLHPVKRLLQVCGIPQPKTNATSPLISRSRLFLNDFINFLTGSTTCVLTRRHARLLCPHQLRLGKKHLAIMDRISERRR
jgi:hypothetical protein